MFTRARALAVTLVMVASAVSGVAIADATGRPMVAIFIVGLGALIASVVLVVGTGSRDRISQ
jgi:hypothetical protein